MVIIKFKPADTSFMNKIEPGCLLATFAAKNVELYV